MAWGGPPAGSPFGGSSSASSSAAGLPFAGIPPELADRVEGVLATEPAHPEPDVVFTHTIPDRRPFTLRRFLAPFRRGLLGA